MALDHDASAASEPPNCQYCSMIKITLTPEDDDEKPITHASLFHDECVDCQQDLSSNNDLCPFCKHLRPGHFFCYWKDDRCSYLSLDISLEGQQYPPLVGYESSESADDLTRDCRLCRMVRNDTVMQQKFLTWVTEKRRNIPEPELVEISCVLNSYYSGESYLRIMRDRPLNPCDLHAYAPQDAPSILPRTVSWDRITGWLDDCVSTHPKCESHSTTAPTYFRLIDIQRKRLIVGNMRYRFAALSYVWGQNPDPSKLKTELSNIKRLECDGGVDTSMLPATIADAIEVCRQLHIDYLWVDRLCIVQDDNEKKQQQYDEMARIYAAAHLVIVVTEGDMDAGIPGVSLRYPGVQRQVTIDGLVFINKVLELHGLSSESDWNLRAWTYQESVFARRKLYFTPVQAIFICDKETYYEDPTQADHGHGGAMYRVNRDDGIRSFDIWAEHVFYYTGRLLSHSSDIYNAFAGIQHAFIGEKNAFFCGLPRGNFNEALLWRLWKSDGTEKRMDCGHVPSPSWSWSSWVGPARYTLSDYFVGTLVAWEHQKGSIFCPVQDHKALGQRLLNGGGYEPTGPWESPDAESQSTICMFPSTKTRQRLYKVKGSSNALIILAIAWSHGCLETPWPFSDFKDYTFLDLATELELHWDSYQDLEREVVHGRPCGVFSDQQENFDLWPGTKAKVGLTESTLRGWVQFSFFHFKCNDDWDMNVFILGADGKPAGSLYISLDAATALNLLSSEHPKEELIALSLGCFPVPYSLGGDYLEHYIENEDMWEKVSQFLGDSFKDNEPSLEEVAQVCAGLGPDGLDFSFVDADGSAMACIPVVYVMLIRWNGPVAYRVCVGWMLLTRWLKSNPQFKTVYLD